MNVSDDIKAQQLTRLSSNLSPTTHEWVHLVTHDHFRSRDKDGGHTENPILHANFTTLCSIEPVLLSIEVLHCGNRNFRPCWLLWPWSWPDDLHIQTWPVVRGDTPHVQMWTYYVQGFESYSNTDTNKIIYHAASQVSKSVYHRVK